MPENLECAKWLPRACAPGASDRDARRGWRANTELRRNMHVRKTTTYRDQELAGEAVRGVGYMSTGAHPPTVSFLG
jgi:hypothetical protein